MLYFVFTDRVDPNHGHEQVKSLAVDRWIFFGEDSTWGIRAKKGLLRGIPRESINHQLDKVSRALRQEFIDWIGSLSLVNESAEWWASELAAKNPYTNLYVRICYLSLGRQLISDLPAGNTLIACSSRVVLDELSAEAIRCGIPVIEFLPSSLRQTIYRIEAFCKKLLRSALENSAVLAPVFLHRIFGRKVREKLNENPEFRLRHLRAGGGVVEPFVGKKTVLLLTWLDKRSFLRDGSYTDPHLGKLAEMLQALGFEVRYVVRVLPGNDFIESLRHLCDSKLKMYCIESFIDTAAVRRCRARARAFFPIISVEDRIGGVPVYRLVSEHLVTYQVALAQTLMYEEFAAGLDKHGVHPAFIIHTCEGHSWEQALALGLARYMPSTKVVGYENGTFTPMLHSMYPARSEWGKRPVPDLVVTYGKLSREILLREGWPPGRVREGCALRHDYLCHLVPRAQPICEVAPDEVVTILVATGIGSGETVELIEKALDAFAGLPLYRLFIKCHPMVSPYWIRAEIGERAEAENVCFVTTPIQDLLPQSHILFYTYTTVCFEALAHGVLPVFVQLDSFMNLNKMEEFAELYWTVGNGNEMRSVVQDLSDMSKDAYGEWLGNAQAAVRKSFTPVSKEAVRPFIDKPTV